MAIMIALIIGKNSLRFGYRRARCRRPSKLTWQSNKARRDFPSVVLRKRSAKAEAKNKNLRKAGKLRLICGRAADDSTTRAREAGFGALLIRD